MKTIGLVTIRRDAGDFLKAQLDELLMPLVKVNLYVLSELEEMKTLTDESLIIFTGSDAYQRSKEQLKYSCSGLIANRSISYQMLDAVLRVPEGTKTYLYNDFESSAIQTIEYLELLGINHLEYLPLFPGATMNEEINTIISIGELENFPKEGKQIIELGARTIDISTIVEILLRLDISSIKIGDFAAKYIKNIIDLTNTINRINLHNEFIKDKLQTVINTINDGIIVVDGNENISVINQIAEKILMCDRKMFLDKNIDELQIENPQFYDLMAMIINAGDEILNVNNKKIVVSQSKIITDEDKIEDLYVLREVTEIQELEQKLRMKITKNKYQARYTLDNIIGESEAIRKQKAMAKQVARFDSPVYIYGESGTGKELFAQAIHLQSPRKDGPFVAVNFAAMSESLIESELFGYVEGAFTGARKGGAPGLFEQAHGGTLFLDEIGDAPLNFQVKLLRVLQEKTVRRIGDDKVIPIDVRIISATNKNIEELVKQGKFREDLFYRINVLPLDITPLRERKQDIELFCRSFYEEFTVKDSQALSFSEFFENVKTEIIQYDFPGNVRQLRNMIEFMVCTSVDGLATKENLPKGMLMEGQTNRNDFHHEEDRLNRILYLIGERNSAGVSVGRRSLAVLLDIPESAVKKIIDQLCQEELVHVSKGRGGIKLSEKGKELLKNHTL